MFRYSAKFQQALYHTVILATASLTMIFLWAYWRMPESSLQIIVFAFFSAVKISDFSSLSARLKTVAKMLTGAVILQYTISVTANFHLLNAFLPAMICFIILKKLPPETAYPVLLTGVLTYSATPGAHNAAERSVDLLIAGATALIITSSAPASEKQSNNNSPSGQPLTTYEAFTKTLTVFCAIFLYHILSIPQGIWIILTVIFIYLAKTPDKQNITLARQRIISVPAGIILGGIYSGSAVIFDYRLAYLAPLIGAAGFFALFYYNDFFSFSLLFLFAFTVYADWSNGTFREFNFQQLLFARSLATVIGAWILLIIEKSSAGVFGKIAST